MGARPDAKLVSLNCFYDFWTDASRCPGFLETPPRVLN
jgi:hypothetical protein